MFPTSICPAHATSAAACVESIHVHAKRWTDVRHLSLAVEPSVHATQTVSVPPAEHAHVRHRGLLFGVDADAFERSEQHRGSMLASLAPVPVLQNATIVLDAANICMRYGDGKSFVTAGLAQTIAWFGARGHRCIACVPDYCVCWRTRFSFWLLVHGLFLSCFRISFFLVCSDRSSAPICHATSSKFGLCPPNAR